MSVTSLLHVHVLIRTWLGLILIAKSSYISKVIIHVTYTKTLPSTIERQYIAIGTGVSKCSHMRYDSIVTLLCVYTLADATYKCILPVRGLKLVVQLHKQEFAFEMRHFAVISLMALIRHHSSYTLEVFTFVYSA